MNPVIQHVAAASVPYAFPQLWRYVTMFLFFLGFATSIGSATAHRVVLRPALRAGGDGGADDRVLRDRSAALMASAGVLFLVSLYPQLAGKVARATDGTTFGQALHPSAVWHYLDAPGKGGGLPQGIAVLFQFALYAVGALLLIALLLPAVRRRADALSGVAAVVLAVASVLLGVSGDLGAETADDWMGKLPSYVHVLGACTWAGGLMTLALLGTVRRRLTPAAGPVWHHVWKRFSRVALVCVGGVICSGLWMAWDAVGRVPLLWQTGFGRFLMLKMLLVLTLICCGAFNEFVLLPRLARLRSAGDERGVFAVAAAHFPKVVALEGLLATAVLLVVPFLNGTAREQGGLAPSHVTGGVFTAAAVLVLVVLVSFAAGAKVQSGVEHRAAAGARPAVPEDAVTS